MYHDNDSSASGYIAEPFEGLSQTFTDIDTLRVSETNVVAKGKRYGRWWLMKGLRREVADEAGYRQRLRKELEILMLLQHPNIVTAVGMESVGDVGECIVMEFIDGMTLREWLQESTTRHQRRRVAHELMAAVGYMHTKGIVHRDLKPENIMITANGENVKLVDFGLADTDCHAILKQPAGTPRYMSPEQAQTAIADVRNDIYSLGMLFGEMKLGYGHIVRKCLLPSENRYQNVASLQAAVQAHDRRRPKAVAAAATLLILLLAGLVGVQTMRIREVTTQTAGNRAEQKQLGTTVALLTDSLDRMSILHQQLENELGQMKETQKQQYTKRQQIEKATDKGKAMIDKVIKKAGIEQHFDTLSNVVYMDYNVLTKTFDEMTAAFHVYMEQIKDDYTENEGSEIFNRINIYDADRRKKLIERYNQIRSNQINEKK